MWWPNLFESLNAIKGELSEEKSILDKNLSNEILEEILELSRTNQKILRSPDILFPPEYFDYILKRVDKDISERDRNLFEDQRHITMELKHRIMQIRDILEIYKSERKYIDEDFAINLHRFVDLVQNHLGLSDQINRVIRRKLM